MHIAIGYYYFPWTLGLQLENALRSLGHTISFVGLPGIERAGYDNRISICDIIDHLHDKPDLYLWIDSGGPYFPPGIEELNIPTACYLIDVHLGNWRPQVARFFDAVFVAQKNYVEVYKQTIHHPQIYWLPLASAFDIHQQSSQPRIYDIGFVGSMTRAHRNTARAHRLRMLATQFRMNDFNRRYLPEETSRVYNQSRLVINVSINSDVNMRVFEATSCGALLLTDSNSNGLSDLFEIGREIVIYNDDTDLLEKAQYYLKHDAEREQIASAGCVRTQREHRYQHRAGQILSTLSSSDFVRAASMRTASSSERLNARIEIYTHMHMLDAIADATRSAGYKPLHRAWAMLPCLARRLIS